MPMKKESRGFRDWYDLVKTLNRLSDDPYDLRHQYDYRAAYESGAKPGPLGHLPSAFKAMGHPDRFVDGIDTVTGLPARPEDVLRNIQIQGLLRKMFEGEE